MNGILSGFINHGTSQNLALDPVVPALDGLLERMNFLEPDVG